MSDDSITEFKEKAFLEIDRFREASEGFYDLLENACNMAKGKFANALDRQQSHDIQEIKKSLLTNQSLGFALVDLIFLFLPTIGGHVFEKVAMSFFKNKIISRFALTQELKKVLQQEKKDLSEKYEQSKLFEKFYSIEGYSKKIREVDGKLSRIQGNPELLNKYIEYSLPTINDSIQSLGNKLYEMTKNEEYLGDFKNYSGLSPRETDIIYSEIINLYKNDPGELIQWFLNQIIYKEKSNLIHESYLFKYTISVCNDIDYLKNLTVEFQKKRHNIPSGREWTTLDLKFTEVLRAMIWILYLGDPTNWARNKSSEGVFIKRSLKGRLFEEWEFGVADQMENLTSIKEELLTSFHPFLFDDNIERSFLNFKDYVYQQKEKALGSYWTDGVAYRKRYTSHLNGGASAFGSGSPNPGNPLDFDNQNYSADDAALLLLVDRFKTMYFNNATNLSSYLNTIVRNHRVDN